MDGGQRVNGIGMGNPQSARDHRQAVLGDAAHDLPGMFGAAAQQNRPMLVRDVQAGRRGLALLALSKFGRGVF